MPAMPDSDQLRLLSRSQDLLAEATRLSASSKTCYLSMGIAVSLVIYSLVVVVHRLFFSPLAKFPGPKLAAATSWYETFFDLWGNNFPEELERMHAKYGPIVRVTPTELSINDAEYYNEVYVTAGRRRTNFDAGPRAGLGMQDAISITADHDLHEMRRKAVANFFSRPNVTRVESRIHNEVRLLDTKLQELKGTGTVVALDHAFSAFTGDLVGQFTCGEHPQLLNGTDFTPQWHYSLYGVLRMVPLLRNLGWVSTLLKLVPVSWLTALNPEVAGFRMFTLIGEGQVDKIKLEVSKEDKAESSARKESVFHDILRSDMPPAEKDSSRLKREAFALLAAGTITTAGTLSLITYFILADPIVEQTLREELAMHTKGFPDEVPRWADLEKLPYLRGCIKEGLRIGRFFRRNNRIAPDHELKYKDWIIPKNTPVGMSVCFLHMDPEVFPDPYKFKPERWVGEYNPLMNRNFVPFTKGSRNCLGMNLAWSELYVCIAILFRSGGYRMTLVGTDESDMVPIYDSDVGIPKRDSKGLNVRFD